MATKVYVVNRPKPGQERGDWAVRLSNKIISHHRKKTTAVKKGRTEARKRGGILQVQKMNGQWETIANYS